MNSVDQRTTGGKVSERVNSSVKPAQLLGIKNSLGSKAEGTIVEDAIEPEKEKDEKRRKAVNVQLKTPVRNEFHIAKS